VSFPPLGKGVAALSWRKKKGGDSRVAKKKRGQPALRNGSRGGVKKKGRGARKSGEKASQLGNQEPETWGGGGRGKPYSHQKGEERRFCAPLTQPGKNGGPGRERGGEGKENFFSTPGWRYIQKMKKSLKRGVCGGGKKGD